MELTSTRQQLSEQRARLALSALGTVTEDRSGATTATTFTDFDYDVAILGLGYVGLPTALAYRAAGHRIAGIDVSEQRVAAIRRGDVDLIPSDRVLLESHRDSDGLLLTTDLSALRRAAAVIICVPTPVSDDLSPQLSILHSACMTAVTNAVTGQLIVLTSTTYVGCTEELVVQPLRDRGMNPGEDVHVVFSPERIDPGNVQFGHEAVPRVIGGVSPACAARAVDLLGSAVEQTHVVSSPGHAEMTKLLENTFRAVNIALANEFADICRELDLDVSAVIDAAATKPYGFMKFTPGPGVGGHCIPCDPHYLLWQLRRQRVAAPMITQAMHEISHRPGRVVDRAKDLLAENGIPLSGARVLVVGVAYKPNVADARESPAIEILQRFWSAGALSRYYDPLFPSVTLPDGHTLTSVPNPGANEPDIVVLHTLHRDIDLSWITPKTPVLDTTYGATDIAHRSVL
ncbi:nucleotide sugar dehydrogenase [Pseudoclavibacter sp. CFCC 13796]|uniref:nucleotide sugar dehydrogenase n=1 Tax=Pseudoclavibacter sp. CFCC 13796 TaxID=2615179 RepID=UPI001CE400A9|nr:nucleotide sugar dehydrogenase [Pseudoclavibacter sp. CFCC 13796]